MITETVGRVLENTPQQVNQRIRWQTEQRLACCAAGGAEAIARRLAELDAEWDVERALEATAAGVGLIGIALGVTAGRKWLVLPALVAGLLMQHAVQKWCPPLPAMRLLGFRTGDEIEQERYALKALRGDFHGVQPVEARPAADSRQAFEAAGR
jgi:hypothetical protein